MREGIAAIQEFDGILKKIQIGFASTFKNHLLWWTIQDYKLFRFGTTSSCSKSCSFHLSLEGPSRFILGLPQLLALWLLFPPLKLKSIEMGLSRCVSSNFSLNVCFDFGVLLVGQSKYHPQDAMWPINHFSKRSFLYMVLFLLGSH